MVGREVQSLEYVVVILDLGPFRQGVSLLAAVQMFVFYFRYAGELANGYVIVLFMLILFDCFLTWYAHRRNILALLAGEEHHTSVRKLSHGKKDS